MLTSGFTDEAFHRQPLQRSVTARTERHTDMDSKQPDRAEIEPWIAALRDRDGMTREHARQRLVTLGSTVTPFLLPLLSDSGAQTRWEAAKALSDIADPTSIPALLHTLEDHDDGVSWVAAEALAAIGPPVAIPLLHALIEKTESVALRRGVHHVLRELRPTEIGNEIADVYTALDCMHPDEEILVGAARALRALESVG
jgi:HEAT repeat protein